MSRFEHVNRYDGTIEQVHAMLLDPAFREQVCAAMHAVEHDVSIDRSASAATVRVAQTQVARKIPPIAQRLIGETVEIVQTEEWTAPDQASFSMVIPGKPGQLHGTVRLQQVGDDRVEQTFAGDLEVAVPLVGGKLESLVAGLLGKALDAEERVGLSWLARLSD